MGPHFHDWIDYSGVSFCIELLEWGRTDFWERKFFILTVSKLTDELKVGYTNEKSNCP